MPGIERPDMSPDSNLDPQLLDLHWLRHRPAVNHQVDEMFAGYRQPPWFTTRADVEELIICMRGRFHTKAEYRFKTRLNAEASSSFIICRILMCG
ncbi:hypothetical protein F2P81_002214 [Scophthalmus maximus]|uniref:Uncharacterized protein n=1 Tax=Scophthalmus maximus TaxID=52904 RepID=A0A6A4TKE3_SCOMX|nr:hypothetical protein F2P81_002214 [Scophthalmus maximus]